MSDALFQRYCSSLMSSIANHQGQPRTELIAILGSVRDAIMDTVLNQDAPATRIIEELQKLQLAFQTVKTAILTVNIPGEGGQSLTETPKPVSQVSNEGDRYPVSTSNRSGTFRMRSR